MFEQADCRVAWLVAATPDEARMFLGPWADEILTFVDPDRIAIKGFGLERLPAIVHLGMAGRVVGAAEGWHPAEWRAVVDQLAKILSWRRPASPVPATRGRSRAARPRLSRVPAGPGRGRAAAT